MSTELLSRFLLCSLAINYLILLIWFFAFAFARNWIKQMHNKWFRLDDTTFDAIHYGGMAVYKIGIFLFCLTPWVALSLLV